MHATSSLLLVAASEMIQRSIEELSHLIIQLLNAVQLDRQQFLRDDAVAGKVDEPVLADVATQVVLANQERVNQLADRHALTEARSPHVRGRD